MSRVPERDTESLVRLSLNTATTKHWTLEQAVSGAVAAGIPALGLWRDKVQEVGVESAAKLLRSSGLRVSTLCRGGFLTAVDANGIDQALANNRVAIDEAAALGAPELVMVVGGLPDGDRRLDEARTRVAERLDELAPYAAARGVRLALEPLHPMYCADRAVLSTLGQALELARHFPSDVVGVVVDTFHVWWDPNAQQQIAVAGQEGRIASYQVCDWNLPIAKDALLSRGMMGDGHIDFDSLTRWVSAAGYAGDVEVEIFNEKIWATPYVQVLETLKQRYCELVLPAL